MANAQKIILIAMAAVGLVCLAVGFSLMHYIGGFMRTVEEEARQEADSESDRGGTPDVQAAQTDQTHGSEK